MRKHWIKRAVTTFSVLTITTALTGCSPMYVIRAGVHEAKILSRRRPITSVIADPSTPDTVKRKLDLVVQARAFAEHRLKLAAGDSYTTYAWVESDTLLMVIHAAYPDRFKAYTWWFPIVGRVPYKGYFNFQRAYDDADKLKKQGFDTYVRPSGAFSTLGWFNDPLLSSIVRYGDISLASTVIHEILHNTVYIPSQVAFNESFASFVGDRGAIEFFCARDGDTARSCDLSKRSWHDTMLYGAFLTDLTHRLESVYNRADLDKPAKLAQKAQLIAEARRRFVSDVVPDLQTTGYRGFAEGEISNATLIGTRLYYERLDLFERVFQQYRDLHKATDVMIQAARSRPKDPYGAIEALVSPPTTH